MDCPQKACILEHLVTGWWPCFGSLDGTTLEVCRSKLGVPVPYFNHHEATTAMPSPWWIKSSSTMSQNKLRRKSRRKRSWKWWLIPLIPDRSLWVWVHPRLHGGPGQPRIHRRCCCKEITAVCYSITVTRKVTALGKPQHTKKQPFPAVSKLLEHA